MSRIVLVSLSATLAALASVRTVSAQQQPRCSPRAISATGTPGFIHFTGQRSARLAWSAKVRAELGEPFATWDRATSRNIECVRADGRYLCSASATPCKSHFGGSN
jgi:hypothetical protein